MISEKIVHNKSFRILPVLPYDYLTPYCKRQISKWYERNNMEKVFGPINCMPFEVFIGLCSSSNLLNIFSNSILDQQRQQYILRRRQFYADDYVAEKLMRLQKIFCERTMNDIPGDQRKPAWVDISLARKRGYRLAIGFSNIGCSYRLKSKTAGCDFCGLFEGSSRVVNREDLIEQAKNAYRSEYVSGHPKLGEVRMIEFLGDGSWYSDEEIYPDARKDIMAELSKNDNIHYILVESRPEFISIEKIDNDLKALRNDQTLIIALGIESSDDFINSFCNNKGYSINEFDAVIRKLQPLKDRIEITAYNLFKPAFLTEGEALQDSLLLAKILDRYAKNYGFSIEMKIEPMVISKGTLIESLYSADGYEVPSYWSIAELLLMLHQLSLSIGLRIGGRNDMDDFIDVAAVYTEQGMFAPVDFIVYNAVQQFNGHQDTILLLADLADACKDPSYMRWKERMKIEVSYIDSALDRHRNEISAIRQTTTFRHRNDAIKRCYKALDEIEYSEEMQACATAVVRNGCKDSWAHEIHEKVKTYFYSAKLSLISLRRITLMENYLGLLRMEFSVLDNNLSEPIIGWLGIPTRRSIKLPTTNIYSSQ